MKERINTARHWIFDLDGTLTQAIHDFAAIKRRLGLPGDQGILESLQQLPPVEAEPIAATLDAIEWELAGQARPGEGAAVLLEKLRKKGVDLGILTRNTKRNAVESLRAAQLDGYFEHDLILGRDQAEPKPDPAGVLALLQRWRARPHQAVLVGDFEFDLQAGRAAGVTTVHLDSGAQFPWPEVTDVAITSLLELAQVLGDA